MEILFNTGLEGSPDKVNQLNDFIQRENTLIGLKVDEIKELFDQISKYMSSKHCTIQDTLIQNELGFIILWLKKANIEQILKINFKDYTYLDSPKYSKEDNTILYARPLGNAVHWIAGNVPVLGVISLFQTLLTKNKSIVKVPKSFKNILSDILNDLRESDFFKDELRANLEILLNCIMVIYLDRNDERSQMAISKIADIRIAWGGAEAIESISKLPKKINTKDLIFGPKLSLCYVSKNSVNNYDELKRLCKSIADDVFAFNQAGCNAPHNIVVEKKFKFSIQEFCNILSEEFDKKAKKSKQDIDPILGFNLLVRKFLFQSDSFKDVHEGPDNQWNIFTNISNEIKELESPLFSRNVFISEIESVNDLPAILPINVQSIGLKVDEKSKLDVIKILSDFGVDRFPEIGKMSIYQHPWDGYLPLQQTVKWISAN
ncbi:hypothetical protein N9N89_03955 [Gammaproteobacteria bacterium]|nr:hypothetical protein [Gammaproteobacteria bacterium]